MVPLGRDIGYLPGTIEEKLHSWMLPVFDNMEFIGHSIQMARHFQEIGEKDTVAARHQHSKGKRHHDKKEGKPERHGIMACA